jgi:hypothetical protein
MSEAHAVELPALDGRIPLGFLASLGLLSILAGEGLQPRLSFSEHTAAAIIHSPLGSLAEVADLLVGITAATKNGTAIPGIAAGFPPQGHGHGDPLRRPRDEYRQMAAAVGELDPRAADHWLPHLVTDLAVDNAGRAAVTPVTAQDRQASLEGLFAGALGEVRENPGRIREALAGWRRAATSMSGQFDDGAVWSAADDPQGQHGAERGVPGATWLAIMSLPQLRLTGDGQRAMATLWHHVGRRRVMLWPLWRQPLTPAAIRVLIEHRCLMPASPPARSSGPAAPDSAAAPPHVAVRSASWPRLGIIGVYGGERVRIPGQRYQRPLAPAPVQVLD